MLYLSFRINLDCYEPITGLPFIPPASRRHRIFSPVNVCPNQHCWSAWSTSHCSINWYQPAAVFNQRCNNGHQRQQEYYDLRDLKFTQSSIQSCSDIVSCYAAIAYKQLDNKDFDQDFYFLRNLKFFFLNSSFLVFFSLNCLQPKQREKNEMQTV